jgi:hypothetical protein
MKVSKGRTILFAIAVAAALLTCLLVADLRLTCHLASEPPALCYYHGGCIVGVARHAWGASDYVCMAIDIAFWWVIYYGSMRGFSMMVKSPYRLPFSRRRAYGEDPTRRWPPP